MNILTIAYYNIIRFFRDKKSFIYMLALPIILILILGSALDSNFKINSIDRTKVVYVNKDGGNISKNFDEFLDNKEVKELIEVEKMDSYQLAFKELNDDKIKAIIYINEDYSDKVKKGEKAPIEVIGSNSNSFRFFLVKNLVSSFIEGANTSEALAKISDRKELRLQRWDNITEESISLDGKRPKAVDYYAVTMMVMIIMYGASYGVAEIGENYMNPVGKRINSTPLKGYENFLGKTIAIVFTMSFQFIALILFSKYAYKANFGSHILFVIFVCFSLSILSTFLGVALCLIFKDKVVAGRILNIIVPIFTFISGGYFVVDGMFSSGLIKKLLYISPNYLAQKAIFNNIYGGAAGETQVCILALWIMILVLLVVSVFAGRRFEK